MSQNPNHHPDFHKYRPHKLSVEEIKEGCINLTGEEHGGDQRLCVINEEFRQGLEFAESINRSVTCFGSARLPEDNEHYQQAQRIAYRISKELDYAIITGGGPGIMEAANRGAHEAGGRSIGMTIHLPHEQFTNPYVKDELQFYFFFSRKVSMTYSAEAYIYFPGGFGTMDELFEILTLVQTDKISKVPIILVGEDYWRPLENFIRETLRDNEKTISPEDMDLFTITDDEEKILEIVRNAPIRNED